mgnify:CR=1 FL=1
MGSRDEKSKGLQRKGSEQIENPNLTTQNPPLEKASASMKKQTQKTDEKAKSV